MQELNTELSTNSKDRILYSDEHLVIFNKYPGDICESYTKESRLDKNFYVPEIVKKNLDKNTDFCQCFNRLDRPVSGANILLFNQKIFAVLQNQFTNSQSDKKNVKNIYWAIVEGNLPVSDDFELLEHFIKFDASKQKAYVSVTEQKKTKKAKLLWRCIGSGTNYSFLEIQLLTGRTHQIRAQLAKIGLHIKGDVKYGARRQDTLGGIRLHARSIEFIHPITKKTIFVSANLPVIDPLWQAFLDVKK